MLILGAIVLLVLGLTNGSSGLLVGSIGTSLLAAVALVVGVRQATAARAATGLLDDDEDEQFADDENDEFSLVDNIAASGRISVPVRAGERSGRAKEPGWSDEPPWSQEPGWSDEPTRVTGRQAGSHPDLSPATDEPDDFRSGEFRRTEVDRDGDTGYPVDGYAGGRQSGQNGTAVPAQQSGARDDYDDDEDPPDEPLAQRVSAADAARVARMSAEVVVIDGRPRYHVTGCVHLLGRPFEPLPVSEAVELGFSPCGLCEPDSSLLADARRV